MVRVQYQRKATQAEMLQHLQSGGGLKTAHMAYGAGLGSMARHKHRYIVPALRGAVKGAVRSGVKAALSPHSGSFRDQVVSGAVRGGVEGALTGRGLKKKKASGHKKKAHKRPF